MITHLGTDYKGVFHITAISDFTGESHTMAFPTIERNAIEKWLHAPLGVRPSIQQALPNIPAHEREFLLTGATPEEWKSIFGEGPEELDE